MALVLLQRGFDGIRGVLVRTPFRSRRSQRERRFRLILLKNSDTARGRRIDSRNRGAPQGTSVARHSLIRMLSSAVSDGTFSTVSTQWGHSTAAHAMAGGRRSNPLRGMGTGVAGREERKHSPSIASQGKQSISASFDQGAEQWTRPFAPLQSAHYASD